MGLGLSPRLELSLDCHSSVRGTYPMSACHGGGSIFRQGKKNTFSFIYTAVNPIPIPIFSPITHPVHRTVMRSVNIQVKCVGEDSVQQKWGELTARSDGGDWVEVRASPRKAVISIGRKEGEKKNNFPPNRVQK